MKSIYKMEQRNSKHRSWCYTINNYTQEDELRIQALDGIKYSVYGRETGSESTPHMQGYIQFSNPRNWNGTKSKIGGKKGRAHIEVAASDGWTNREYCTKDGDYWEKGDVPKQGDRKDIKTINEDVLIHGKMVKDLLNEDLITNYQQLRYAEGLQKYAPVRNRFATKESPELASKIEIKWYWGETGSGKTKSAIEFFGDNDYWISGRDLKWFEGYYGQKYVLIDDFRGDFCTFHFMLRLTDIYPLRVEVKGSSIPWVPYVIIITCPYHPEDVYQTVENKEQLYRRISEVRYFGEKPELEQRSGGNTNPCPWNVSDII